MTDPRRTPFTPDAAALVLVDFQGGTMQLIKNIPEDTAKRNGVALAKMAKILDMPVVLTSSQEENAQGPIIRELREALPDEWEARVQRTGIVNAWDDPNFVSAIEATGRKQLVMAGITTDVCLVYPTISAVEDGYAVQAVMDASGSPFGLSEDMARLRMSDAGVVLTATNTVIAELAQDWSTEAGKQLIGMLFSDILPNVDPDKTKAAT